MDRLTTYLERMLPVLVHIQNHLDEDLSLETVAGMAHYSPFHFHRVFRETVGETLKQYTRRLRLERAAIDLSLRGASILTIALECGFQNHETFTRAFKRFFKITPEKHRQQQTGGGEAARHAHMLNRWQRDIRLSKPRVRQFKPIDLAFIRHLGPYTEVDPSSFDRLQQWAQTRGHGLQTPLLIGIGHDAPNITAAEKLRFDACIQVPGPFPAEGSIAHQLLPEGSFAVTSYIGPYGAPMEQAYGQVFMQLGQLKDWQLLGLPAVEIYHTTRINPEYALNHTDICIPVQPK